MRQHFFRDKYMKVICGKVLVYPKKIIGIFFVKKFSQLQKSAEVVLELNAYLKEKIVNI